jgi:hypothetical protein
MFPVVFPSQIRRWAVPVCIVIACLGDATFSSAGDWPMRGRDQTRNAVVPDQQGPDDWHVGLGDTPARNIRWAAKLGSISCGDPVVSDGLVWVGTNNRSPRDPEQTGDASVLMCFRERDGEFLYQYVSPRLPEGRRYDWPDASLASSPLIEGDRLWFCNNRCEVICLDIAPLLAESGTPRVVWKVDMRSEFGVVPRGVMIGSHASHCSIASYGELIYVNTTNAAGYDGIPAPEAPSLICFEKRTGRVRWQDNSPGEKILDVQHGSPLVIEIDGKGQVVMGQGDGWGRGFDALRQRDIEALTIDQACCTDWQLALEMIGQGVLEVITVRFACSAHADGSTTWEPAPVSGRLILPDGRRSTVLNLVEYVLLDPSCKQPVLDHFSSSNNDTYHVMYRPPSGTLYVVAPKNWTVQ